MHAYHCTGFARDAVKAVGITQGAIPRPSFIQIFPAVTAALAEAALQRNLKVQRLVVALLAARTHASQWS